MENDWDTTEVLSLQIESLGWNSSAFNIKLRFFSTNDLVICVCRL